MAQAITIPASVIRGQLTSLGFVEKATSSSYSPGEVYFEKPFPGNPQLVTKVYTSLSVGATHTRSTGSDAIRVCLVWRYDVHESQSVGLIKTVRVHRVTSVKSTMIRVLNRVREVNRKAFELDQGKKCEKCGCPANPTSGRCRNKDCERSLASSPKNAAGASMRLNTAFGAVHSLTTQVAAAGVPTTLRIRPVTPARAAQKVEVEAARNRAEEPVLTDRDMPADMRHLF